MDVSVVIPNWNGKEHLEVCLTSVRNQTLPPAQMIIVDNGSTDGSVEFLSARFPEVKVIRLEKNYGFAYAVNRGIEAAEGSLIALLNNDTELDPEWLEHLVAGIEGTPEAGSVTGKMLDFADRSKIDGVGDMLSASGVPFARGHGERDRGQYDACDFVFSACAGASLYRRSLFKHIGMFDEDFISYYEDVDLSFRSQLAGYTCRYVPEAICYHKGNATASGMGDFMSKMLERNLILYYTKNYSWSLLLLMSPFILIAGMIRAGRYLRAGRLGAACSGFTEGILLLPKMTSKRKDIQSRRKVSDRYVRRYMKWKKRGG